MVSILWGRVGRRGSSPLKRLLALRKVCIVPGIFNPMSALLAEELGFRAVYLSGAALSASLAMPDIGLLTLHEVAQQVRYISYAVDVPIIVDADTGFGEVMNVDRAVRELEEVGASAIQIEDQEMPKKCGHLTGKRVIPRQRMVEKIKAAMEARANADFLVVARIDSRGVYGFEDAVGRGQVYAKAGADIIFPEALETIEEFREFARRVRRPLMANMTEFGRTPYMTAKQFQDLGYSMVVFPVTAFRVAAKAIEQALLELKDKGTQTGLLDLMQTRQELYDLIKYGEYEKKDRKIAEEARKVIRGV